MKKKFGLLIMGMVTSVVMSLMAYAQPAMAEEINAENIAVDDGEDGDIAGNSYMTIVRASGETEIYLLDEVSLGMSTVAADEVTVVRDVLVRRNTSVDSASDDSLVQPLSSTYNFDWTVKGGYIAYSDCSFDLREGDWVSCTISTQNEFSIEIGLFDNDEQQFISAGYWGGTDDKAWTFKDSFQTTKDLDHVSFAIKNLADKSKTFKGSFVMP